MLTAGNPLPFPDSSTLHGPAPAPTLVRNPRVHVLDGDAYAATQTDDAIRTGDILVVPGVAIGVMLEAWPVLVRGSAELSGFHALDADANVDALGADRWGRDLGKFGWLPPRGGYNLAESFAIAAAIDQYAF